MRSTRWPPARDPRVPGSPHRRDGAERPRTWPRARSQPGSVSSARGDVVVSFHRVGLPILSGPTALGRVAVEAVVSQPRAQTAAEYPARLGAQELRPARADAPRRRPQSRPAQHGRDRCGGDADAELQQLALDTYVAPARVLPRQPFDQAACLGRKRGTTGPRAAASPTPCSSARCQRRSVSGLTAKQDHRSRGSSRLAAASKARSAAVYRGRFPPRLRIASWWRRTTSSSSRSPPPRARKRTTPHKSRYSKHASTTRRLDPASAARADEDIRRVLVPRQAFDRSTVQRRTHVAGSAESNPEPRPRERDAVSASQGVLVQHQSGLRVDPHQEPAISSGGGEHDSRYLRA